MADFHIQQDNITTDNAEQIYTHLVDTFESLELILDLTWSYLELLLTRWGYWGYYWLEGYWSYYWLDGTGVKSNLHY